MFVRINNALNLMFCVYGFDLYKSLEEHYNDNLWIVSVSATWSLVIYG